jgi:hypothetical protein
VDGHDAVWVLRRKSDRVGAADQQVAGVDAQANP